MLPQFKELNIDDIKLDLNNPRIQRYIQEYGEDGVTAEGIALALNTSGDMSTNTYDILRESIRVSKGVIHPIIVNHQANGEYIVIEGNTRVQIYKELRDGDQQSKIWDTIMSVVYEQLLPSEIDAIRLQTHLVGPRDWDAYSKAKYLNHLSNVDYMPMSQIVSFCGGKAAEINKLISAYNDMEKYYVPIVDEAGQPVDPREFSKFAELQNKGILQVLNATKFGKKDFAKWVFEGNIDTAQNVRKLRYILINKAAREKFLTSTISEAEKLLNATEYPSPKGMTISQLVIELKNKIMNISRIETRNLKSGEGEYGRLRDDMLDLKTELDDLILDIKED